jgi:hypothetical protein
MQLEAMVSGIGGQGMRLYAKTKTMPVGSVGPKLAAPAWPTAPVAAERASA